MSHQVERDRLNLAAIKHGYCFCDQLRSVGATKDTKCSFCLAAENARLTSYVDLLAKQSVECHRILKTPSGSAMSLAERATEVMQQLENLAAGDPLSRKDD